YVKLLQNGTMSVVISGETANVEKFKNIIKNNGSRRAVISSVKERKRTSPVKIGFEIFGQENEINKSNENNILAVSENTNDGYFPVKIVDVRARKKRVSTK